MMKRSVTVLIVVPALFLLAGCPPPSPTPSPSPTASPGPTPSPAPRPGWDCSNPPVLRGLIPTKGLTGRYTVRLKSAAGVSASAVRGVAARHAGVELLEVTRHGFQAKMTAAAAQRVADDPDVLFVHESVPVKINAVTWGLDRIDERDIRLDGKYEPGADGTGVQVAIVDTGIDSSHPDFEGRVSVDCFSAHGSCVDGHGHGTHVAGTAGSKTWGTAKGVMLYNIRVLDSSGSGTDADVIAGVDWVADRKRANPLQDWVLNMSLGGDPSPAFDAAVCDAITAGVVNVFAAGNDASDACDSSPSRVAQGLTVAASDRFDRAAVFTNKGSCVDIWAPGVDIQSTWRGGSTNTISGTSMASPHVAGGAALYLFRNPGALPDEVEAGVMRLATQGVISGGGSTSNALLYVKDR